MRAFINTFILYSCSNQVVKSHRDVSKHRYSQLYHPDDRVYCVLVFLRTTKFHPGSEKLGRFGK